jgi:hypothetical protein
LCFAAAAVIVDDDHHQSADWICQQVPAVATIRKSSFLANKAPFVASPQLLTASCCLSLSAVLLQMNYFIFFSFDYMSDCSLNIYHPCLTVTICTSTAAAFVASVILSLIAGG